MDENKMICECDVELMYYSNREQEFIELFKDLPCPKGSRLIYGNEFEHEIPIGNLEGLALYINATDLPNEVYETNSADDLAEQLCKALEGNFNIFGHSGGAKELGLFFYGNSFEQMKALIQPIVDANPLCQKCRIVQEA